jgi:hypothetical protein
MIIIQLTMVTGEVRDPEVDIGGEDDGIAATITPRREDTTPVVVNAEHIRNFYPRRRRSDGVTPVGTRITFSNGSGMAVTDTYEQVATKLGVVIV